MSDYSINEALEWQERGLHYGDGLFETLLKINGEIPYWEAHYLRLTKGCQRLQLPIPDHTWLQNRVRTITADDDACVVKILVTRGLGGRGLNLPDPTQSSVFVLKYPYTQPDATALNLSICDTRLPTNKNLAGLKHLNRLDYVLATIELSKKQNKDEAILCDSEGFVVEGIINNLFFCENGQIYTPDLTFAGVEGIMRAKIIAHLKTLGIPVYIDRFNPEQLFRADECYLCNSVQGIRAIGSIDNHLFETGAITQSMISHFNHTDDVGI